MKISGYTCVRNAIRLDYCLEECIKSMLPVCDEVLVCDSESTDGTLQMLQRWEEREPKIKVITYPWPDPKGEQYWYCEWLNFARENLSHPMQLQLDSDEVLDDSPECHAAIREAAEKLESRKFDRLNFWRDAHSIIPEGHCCGKLVTRIGRSELFMPSDEPRHKGECEILDTATEDSRLKIYHLGFLRRREAFYKKANVVLHAFFNRYDTRLEEGEKQGKQLWETECDFADKLVRYDGYYPESVVKWMRERGHWV